MKSLQEYFFESDELQSLKDKIIDQIKQTSSPKLLRKINRLFDVSENDYGNVNNNIIDYLSNHCGFNKKIYTSIIQKLKHFGAFGLFNKIIELMKSDSSDAKFLTSKDLKEPNDIFELIKNFVKPILNDDDELNDEFTELIKDIADFDISGKVATGKMEFLSSMFLKDLNNKNQASEGKVVCDINTNGGGFEYKVSGARIAGNKEESKPKSPEIINQTFINLIINEFIDDTNETDTQKNKNQYSSTLRLNKNLENELDKAEIEKDLRDYLEKLSKTDNIFRNAKGNEIDKILNPIFKFNITEDKLNHIILTSLLSQVPNLKINNEEFDYLFKKYPVAINKEISEEGKNNFKQIFLILGLCNYWKAEQWDYLILFEKPDKKECTGKYKVIQAPNDNNLIKSIDENIKDKCYSGAFPCYGKGTNSQNHAPMIKYKK